VWGRDREQARRRLLRALDEYVLEGPHHNLAFHRWLAGHPAFARGEMSTRFIDEHFGPDALAPDAEAGDVAIMAAALHARREKLRVALPAERDGGGRAWRWGDRARGPERAKR